MSKIGSNWVVYKNKICRIRIGGDDLISLDGSETINPYDNLPSNTPVDMALVVFPKELQNVPDEQRMEFLNKYQEELDKKQ